MNEVGAAATHHHSAVGREATRVHLHRAGVLDGTGKLRAQGTQGSTRPPQQRLHTGGHHISDTG